MNLISRQARNERRRPHAEELRASATGDPAEQDLFDAAFELAEAARRFDEVSGLRGSAAATAAALGCVTQALMAQSVATSKIRSLAMHEFSETNALGMEAAGDAARLGRFLSEVDQDLRAAAEASELAHRTATRILAGSRGATTTEQHRGNEPALR
ncbi:MAG: hypothetical protein R2718_06535 [Solirubrobacterales bacterium]